LNFSGWDEPAIVLAGWR